MKSRPKDIVGLISQEKFVAAQSYNADRTRFRLVRDFYFTLEGSLLLFCFFSPWVWNSVPRWFSIDPNDEIKRSLLFLLVTSLRDQLVSLPFSYYSTFVVEDKHGFRTADMTLRLWTTDVIKSIVLQMALGGPIIAGMIYLIQWGGPQFYLYVWIFLMVVQFVMQFLYPVLIQPCFNTVEELPKGNLRSSIEALASLPEVSYPLKRLYQIDGSRRSAHSNAYMYGFCNNKQIVLFDTLIEQAAEYEVVAVLAHELGHWKLNHTIKNFCIFSAQMFGMLWLFSQFIGNKALYISFGYSGEAQPVIIGLSLFSHIVSPLSHVLGLAMNFWSRKCEFEADGFAVGLGFANPLRTGLIKFQENNLGNMVPDWLYSAYHHSHPPLVERLRAILTEAKKRQ